MRQTKLWFAALAVAVALVGVALSVGCGKKVEETAEVATYTCPMHPEVTSDKPGECPSCGMDLVPMEEGEHGSGETPEHGGM
jgi:predicted RNA-binding Zn-ribbon protein involved in translation (DUF1610 family)